MIPWFWIAVGVEWMVCGAVVAYYSSPGERMMQAAYVLLFGGSAMVSATLALNVVAYIAAHS